MTTDLHHLAGAYALDALDAAERAAYEAHYPTCEICSRDVVAHRETAAELAGATLATPPPELKARVMADVARTRQYSPVLPGGVDDLDERRQSRATRRLAALVAVAAAVVAIVGIGSVLSSGSGDDGVSELLAAPDAIVTDVEGEDTTLRVVWSAALDQVAVVGSDLDDPGDDLTYALWFLRDDGVVPAALFRPDPDGTVDAVLAVADVETDGWGVTIEPAGGSEQPTSDVIFAGTI